MKCGGCTNPEISFWTPIVFWTVRFSSWNNLSCFSSLFLLTPLFFEHQENLSVPQFAPRTPFTLRRGSRQLRPPSLCCYFIHKNQEDKTPMPPLLSGIGCLWTSVAASLRLLAPSPFPQGHQKVDNLVLTVAFLTSGNCVCIVLLFYLCIVCCFVIASVLTNSSQRR